MVSRDLVPMERGCARPRGTGKPLQIAVDDVPDTMEARLPSKGLIQINSIRPTAT